jgi:nitroimidazol reductase NimA-like FMN-containing flavoprotein (pyridoxamine 5'-phosphate oxidase superfamily)
MDEILTILDKSKIIHLGLCDQDQPYVLPMNYGYIYENGTLTFYLHGAKEGYKYELIRKNPKISFELECDVIPFDGKVACQYGMSYSSVFGKGIAEVTDDVEEKIKSLSLLMKTQTGQDFEFNEKLVSIVNVIKVTVTEFTAKKRPIPGAGL